MPSAEIITIGTEILLGEIVDTNTRHIALALRDLGLDLFRTVTIGDNVERIAAAVRESMQRSEVIITTGGLGPTVDDPTREAVAKAAGVEIEYREELWQQVVDTISRYGRKPAENQRRQAMIPKGATAIRNPVGTAPAFILESGRSAIISLPGVPNEMEFLLQESVIPFLRDRYNLRQIIKVRVLHCAGLGEGTIDEKIGDLEKLANPTVGLAAHTGVVDVRIAAKADSDQDAVALIAEIERDVRQRLGSAVFGVDEDRLATVALEAVARCGWSLVGVEAGLKGLLAETLPRTVSVGDADLAALVSATRLARTETSVDVALGVWASETERAAEMVLITPHGERTHRVTYGGPPRSVRRWAVNLALNWLRTVAQESS